MATGVNAPGYINGDNNFAKGKFTAGTAVVVSMAGSRSISLVWCKAAGATTITVEYSVDDGVSYDAWPGDAPVTAASVTKQRQQQLTGALTHVRFTPSVADAASTYGVTQ